MHRSFCRKVVKGARLPSFLIHNNKKVVSKNAILLKVWNSGKE